MQINSNKQRIYNRLMKDPFFGACFPHMIKQIARGNIWTWDNNAITGELTPEHIRHIEELERRHSDEGLAVYAVLDNVFLVGGERVHMTSYLFTTNECSEIQEHRPGVYYAMADVYNGSWDISEMGDVLIQRCAAGGPKRIG